jgi:hypothetical protein
MLVISHFLQQLALIELSPVVQHPLCQARMPQDLHLQLDLVPCLVHIQDIQLAFLLARSLEDLGF